MMNGMLRIPRACFGWFCVAVMLIRPAIGDAVPAQQVAEAVQTSGGGLAVFAGVTDVSEAVRIAATGRWLVHVIDTDVPRIQQTRERIQESVLTGLASAETYHSLHTLPYRDHAVTLLVVDEDRLGRKAPDRKEVLRVLSPKHGLALVKRSNRWQEIRKPWPEAFGNWTHLSGMPNGNLFSQDTAVGVPNGIGWVGETGPDQNNSILIHDGIAIMGDKPVQQMTRLPRRPDVQKKWGKGIQTRFRKHAPWDGRQYMARDAFNGVPRYRIATEQNLNRLVVGDKFIATYFTGERHPGGRPHRMAAYDLRSGEKVVEYTEGLIGIGRADVQKFGQDNKGKQTLWAVAVGDILIQSAGKQVVGLDVNTGKRLWEYLSSENHAYGPVMNLNGDSVYFGEGEMRMGRARYYGARRARNIVRLDAKTGQVIWKTEVPKIEGLVKRPGTTKWHDYQTGKRETYQQLSQIIPVDEEGLVFIAAGDHHNWAANVSYVAALNMKDGSLAWLRGANRPSQRFMPKIDFKKASKEEKEAYFITNQEKLQASLLVDHSDSSEMAMFYRNGKLEYYSSYGILLYDAQTGFASQRNQRNMGCQRSVGTPNLSYIASYAFAHTVEHGEIVYDEVGFQHPHCGDGFVPSHGMWFTESTRFCGCIPHIWSQFSMRSGAVPELLTEDQRLESPDMFPGKDAQPNGQIARIENMTPSPILASWERGHFGPINAKDANFHEDLEGWGPALESGDWTFKSDLQSHRMVAFRNDTPVWSFQAGGRIPGEPLLHNGSLFFGSRDGYVYALDAETGDARWRFLAARNREKIYFSGQLESLWPTTNAVLQDGNVFVAAGIHNQADGGIHAWGLNPEDGSVVWRIRAYTPPIPGLRNGSHNFDHGSRSAGEQNPHGGARAVNGVGLTKNGKPALLYWNRGGGYGHTPLDPSRDDGKDINLKSKTEGWTPHRYPWITEEDLFRGKAKNPMNLTDDELKRALKMKLKIKEVRPQPKWPREKKEQAKAFNERLQRIRRELTGETP